MPQPNGIITLLTDFGDQMGYAGQMKGAILNINPEANITDLSHSVAPQQIGQAAMILQQSVDYFPAGAVHVAVVDPGVGTGREAVAIECRHAWFVGPNNGLFGFLNDDPCLRRIHRLADPRFQLERVSATFHGRDVFAPAAAHLSLGVDIGLFGPELFSLTTLESGRVDADDSGLSGRVMAVDRFGNLISSISMSELASWLQAHPGLEPIVHVSEKTCEIARTFADVPPGYLVAYAGSSGLLEVAVNQGDAEHELGVGSGAVIRVTGR